MTEILMGLYLLGGLFMIVDAFLPTLRIVLQAVCAVVLGLVIAAYIIIKLEPKPKNDEVE